MAIKQSTVITGNVTLVGAGGEEVTVELVSFDPPTGQASYRYANKTWTYLDNGQWSFRSSGTQPVTDDAGNPVAANTALGVTTINIPVPADTTPPVAILVGLSHTEITAPGELPVTVTVRYTDA